MKKEYIQISALCLIIIGSLFSISKNINRNAQVAAISGAGSGLIGYWTFDDGTAADSAGTSSGTVQNTAMAPGKLGNALDFNGTSSYVDLTNTPALAAPFTVSLWIYPRQLGVNGGLFRFGSSGRNLFITSNNTIEFDLYSSGTFRTFCNKTLSSSDLNSWMLLTFVVASPSDASQWKCYINGANAGVVNSNSSGVYADPASTNWRIGNNGLSNGYFNGLIDDVRIYNRTLTDLEVADLGGTASGTTQTSTSTPPAPPPPAPAQTNLITAASCSYADVSAAVSAVDPNGTVEVPAGNCTWDQGITLTKAIILKGGIGGTTSITGTIAPLLKYTPSSPDSSHRFRISGFTFYDMASSNAGVITLQQNTATPEFIRIDNNIFTTSLSRAIYVAGTFYGVVDSNTFNDQGGKAPTSTYGNDNVQWNAFGANRAFGDQYNLYYEDNVYTTTSNGLMNDGGQGGRYVSRYNSFSGNFGYIYDWHGNQPGGAGCYGSSTCGNAATMVVEIYGNLWNRTTSGYLNSVIDDRGGMAMMFMNKLKTTTTGKSQLVVREEYSDDLWPANSGWVQHVANSHFWSNWNERSDGTVLLYPELDAENCGSGAPSPWQPNHLYGGASASSDIYCQKFTNDPNGYVWKRSQYTSPQVSPYLTGSVEPNWSGTPPRYTLRDGNINWLNMGKGTPVRENVDFFTQKSGAFDGSGINGGSVGAGPLSSRPSTCVAGVAYWATNQSVTDVSSMVGPHPATPISGTLYKCSAPNTWVAYYMPYTYPHPLRSGNDLTPPPLVQPYVPPPSPPPATYAAGDFNNDGVVNSIDLSLMAGAWNTNNATYDLNKDGTVNTLDYSIMVRNWTI